MMLNDSVAIVTGSGRGIGRAIALELALAGAKVVVNYAGRADKAEETVELLREAGGECIAVQGDVSQTAEVDRLIKTTLDHFGKIDILVNNAGITRDSLLLRMKEADWDAVLATNLKGVFLCTKAVSKGMLKQRSGVMLIFRLSWAFLVMQDKLIMRLQKPGSSDFLNPLLRNLQRGEFGSMWSLRGIYLQL